MVAFPASKPSRFARYPVCSGQTPRKIIMHTCHMPPDLQNGNVKMRFWFVVIGVLAAIGLWWGMRHGIPARVTAIQTKAGLSSRHEVGHSEGYGAVRTKSIHRELDSTRHTHGPHRLREFMLPAIVIDGLTLDEALRKLMASYRDACGKCGETPLPSTFSMPPGATRKLTVHLPAGNFKTSVQLLAALAGMKVSRKDMDFRFEPMADERKSVNRTLQVSPDFLTVLNELAGVVPASGNPRDPNIPIFIQHCLKKLGLTDPSTHVSVGVSGDLKLETMSAKDAAMISELAKIIGEQAPAQVKTETKIVEIPVDFNWTPPAATQMTHDQVAMMMRDLAQQKGVELQTLPSVTSRNGQNATVEIVREVIYPIDDSGKAFESRNVGKVLHMQGNLLGFGHEVDLKFTDTTGGIDPETGGHIFENRTDMADKSYSGDGGTKIVVQTRPDGSRTLMFLKSRMIDATGQPIH